MDDDARHLSAATTCLPSSSGLDRTPSRDWSIWKIFKPLFLVAIGGRVSPQSPVGCGTERQNPLTPVPASPYLPVLIPVTTRQMLGMQPTPKTPRSAADPTSLLSPKRPCGRLSCSATSTPSSFHSLSSLSQRSLFRLPVPLQLHVCSVLPSSRDPEALLRARSPADTWAWPINHRPSRRLFFARCNRRRRCIRPSHGLKLSDASQGFESIPAYHPPTSPQRHSVWSATGYSWTTARPPPATLVGRQTSPPRHPT
jgi:hypothetical protein